LTCTIVIAVEPDTVGRVALLGGELAQTLTARVVLSYVRKDPPLFNSNMDTPRAWEIARRQLTQLVGCPVIVVPSEA
jgi:hypothetical protein